MGNRVFIGQFNVSNSPRQYLIEIKYMVLHVDYKEKLHKWKTWLNGNQCERFGVSLNVR